MDTDKNYRVLRLIVDNFMRITAADVTPTRNAFVVAGANKQGKTSILSAIAAALGGKRQVCPRPIHTGAEDAQIVCILGDDKPELLVKRVFTSDGKTAIEITSAEGFRAPSPQSILDSLCSSIAFDPLSFLRMDDAKQVETLRKLVGLDFTEADKQRKQLYDERTDVNKRAKSCMAQAKAISVPDGTPEEEVSVADLVAQQRIRAEHNRRNATERQKLTEADADLQRAVNQVGIIKAEIERLNAKLAEAEHYHEQAFAVTSASRATVAVLVDADVDEVQKQIVDSQAINAAVQKRNQKMALAGQWADADVKSKDLTARIEAIDAKKGAELNAVKWPIDGMSFGAEGVLYNNLPFSQASGAEQLEVSFAMSAALAPRLKVCLIRDASLLDDEQMAVVQRLAEQYDTQVWLEVVDTEAGPCGILIEDGTIVSSKPASLEPAPDEQAQPVED
jgi:hypothetical protein